MSNTVVQGWKGQVGFGDQSVFGTKVVPSKWQTCDFGVVPKLNKPNRAPQKAVRAGRHMVRSARGLITAGCTIPMILTPGEYGFGRFWANVFASNTVAGDSADGYVHTFDETDVLATLPAVGETIETNLGSDSDNPNFTADTQFLQTVTLSCPEDGVITMATEWIGRNVITGETTQTPTYATVPPFEGWMGDVLIGANLAGVASVPVKDWQLEISTMVKVFHQKGSQSQLVVGVSYGYPEYKFSWNKVLQDAFTTEYNYFVNDTENSVRLHLKHDTLAGSNAGSEYEWTLNLPRVVWQGETPGLNSEDDQNFTMNGIAMKEQSTNNYTGQLVIKNDESGTYTAS